VKERDVAAVKAADVKKLRDKTGAGMLDCKKALAEADGDFAKAEKLLKEMGMATAAKRSGRATNEGRIFTKIGEKRAALLELACETDFVARNKDFIALGEELVSTVVEQDLTEKTEELEEKVQEAISRIKENMHLKRFTGFSIAENEAVRDYVHGEGNIGVLVKISADSPKTLENEEVQRFAFDCALHIAAFNPLYLSRESVDEQYKQDQEAIFRKQAENLDKPANVVDGIVKGKMNKHFSEICLLEQGFVKDEKQSVAQVMKQIGKDAGGEIELVNFLYYKVGEGDES
jgi:elongation factor Ts